MEQPQGVSNACDSFVRTREYLVAELTKHALAQTPPDWKGASKYICSNNKKEVEHIFHCVDPRTHSTDGGSAPENHRVALRKRLHLSDPEPECTRHQIFAIMLISCTRHDDELWTKFLRLLKRKQDPRDFSDENLPFSLGTRRRLFGNSDSYDHFGKLQWHFIPPLESSFERVLSSLRQSLWDAVEVCKTEEKDSVFVSKHPRDFFLPEDRIRNLFEHEHEKDNIKTLYLESEKSRALYGRLADTTVTKLNPTQRHDMVSRAEENVDRFLKQVLKVPRILAIFILMDVKASSGIWTNFIEKCINSYPRDPPLQDEELPIDSNTLQKTLDCDLWLANRFYETQYTLCAVVLRARELLDRRDHGAFLHLPLLEKSLIGNGAYGDVYRVKVKAHHYHHEDTILAMKRISLREREGEPNEWNKLHILFEQNISHKKILKALAGVRTHDAMLIFFDLADCDLSKYMTEKKPDGPRDEDERRKLFLSMMDIAHVLQYFHTQMLDKDHNRMVCYHKDIKAENILVKSDANEVLSFYVTDLGIASIEWEQAEGSRKSLFTEKGPHPNDPRLTLRAQGTDNQLGDNCGNIAPEARKDGRVNSSTDIWGFGTVFANFIPWLLDGKEGLDSFEEARRSEPSVEEFDAVRDDKFFKVMQDEVCIKPAIANWYTQRIGRKRSQKEEESAKIYESCWKLLEEKLLVCREEDRAKIEDVYESLKVIRRELDSSEDSRSITSPHSIGGEFPARSSFGSMGSPLTNSQHVTSRTSFSSVTTSLGEKRTWAQRVPNPRSESLTVDGENGNGPPGFRENDQAHHSPSQNVLALHQAAERGDLERVRMLLEDGYPLDYPDEDRYTPLLKACQRGSLEVIELFLSKGAAEEAVNIQGSTAVHLAINGSLPIDSIKKLILRFPQLVNVQDKKGSTPLHLCADAPSSYFLQVAEFLLQNGARPGIENNKGESPRRIAESSWSREAHQMLQLLDECVANQRH